MLAYTAEQFRYNISAVPDQLSFQVVPMQLRNKISTLIKGCSLIIKMYGLAVNGGCNVTEQLRYKIFRYHTDKVWNISCY